MLVVLTTLPLLGKNTLAYLSGTWLLSKKSFPTVAPPCRCRRRCARGRWGPSGTSSFGRGRGPKGCPRFWPWWRAPPETRTSCHPKSSKNSNYINALLSEVIKLLHLSLQSFYNFVVKSLFQIWPNINKYLQKGWKTVIKLFIISLNFSVNILFYHIYFQIYHLNFVQCVQNLQ